jgi:hypothetical protein
MNAEHGPSEESAGVRTTGRRRWRRLRAAALLNAGALIATSAVVAALDPKSPPFRCD